MNLLTAKSVGISFGAYPGDPKSMSVSLARLAAEWADLRSRSAKLSTENGLSRDNAVARSVQARPMMLLEHSAQGFRGESFSAR